MHPVYCRTLNVAAFDMACKLTITHFQIMPKTRQMQIIDNNQYNTF